MSFDISITDDFDACFALRRTVFIEEQNVPEEEEHDADDARAIHFLARQNGKAIGTARIVIADGVGKIGRVCVLAEARGTGLGAALMRATLAYLRELSEVHQAKLGAQLHATGFYEKLGFEAFGDVFDDAGIDHIMMAQAV